MEDFEPARVAQQVPALRELLEMRNKLQQLLNKMEGNDKLESMLQDVLANTEKAMALAKEAGISASENNPQPEGS
jgi:type VI secretion system protein ImpB